MDRCDERLVQTLCGAARGSDSWLLSDLDIRNFGEQVKRRMRVCVRVCEREVISKPRDLAMSDGDLVEHKSLRNFGTSNAGLRVRQTPPDPNFR